MTGSGPLSTSSAEIRPIATLQMVVMDQVSLPKLLLKEPLGVAHSKTSKTILELREDSEHSIETRQ